MRYFNEGRAAHAAQEAKESKGGSREKLKRCLDNHVVDITPEWIGSDKLRSTYGGDAVAAVESSINRCDPPLNIPKLTLEHGKSVVLVGPNGAGKSTILDAIMDRRGAGFDTGSHGYGAGTHGKETMRVSRLDQEELLGDVSDLKAGDVIKTATEHFIAQFPVDWEDAEAYDRNLINQEAEQRIQQLVSQVVQLFEAVQFLDRKVSELSGGERTKLSLLMVLASEPDILLLDEPTNHLDLESIAKLTGLFDTYKRAGVSIVNVSHVEWFLDMVGEDGTIELTYTPTQREAVQSGSAYRKFKKKERRKAAIKESIIWSKLPTKQAVGSLFMTNETISIPRSPLKDVDAPLFVAGDIAVLSGKNGTGKTKLMQELADPHSTIMQRDKGTQTTYLPQLWPEEIMNGTVKDFFNWVKEQSNPFSEVSPSQLQKELQRLGLGSERASPLQEPFSHFSGGEQRLLWFTCASIIEGTDALILDEPSNHMDEPTMLKVVEAIRNFPGAIILSTHDLRLMSALENDPGKTRQGRGITNFIFNRTGQESSIEKSPVAPLAFAQQTIAKSRKQAGRVKV
jgi:ATPase subunit of ABC transporter with duplicated ATPase domains